MRTRKANGVEYWQDWDNSEGGIRMVKPKTIDHYHELKNEHPDTEKYGVFFAFGTDQFEAGKKKLSEKGYIKDGDTICDGGCGLYGTKEEISRYYDFYAERDKKIKRECNPQEVYFYEWNNHECMFGNDDSALKCIIETFGKEAAHKIERVYPGTATDVLAPLTDRDKHLGDFEFELMMLGRLEFDMGGFFSEGDCRYHRPDCLWGSSIKSEITEMRKLYDRLPDDIKDASCMTKDEIEDYAERLTQWCNEEFAKPEYDPVPATPICEYSELDLEIEDRLYYKDDDGKWQTPNHVWFSCDTRRFHQDEKMVHGRAMTMYMGKNGTTLAPVYKASLYSVSFEPYRRDDLCDVTARYQYEPGRHSRLYEFYHE